MTSIVVWLFVLACGWNLCRRFLPTRAIAIRNEGHPQYFGAALGAAYIACLAIFLNGACLRLPVYNVAIHGIAKVFPHTVAPDNIDVLAIGLWSGLLVFVVPAILNLPFNINVRLGSLTARKSGSVVETVLLDIYAQEKSVAFTLDTGKVYIGFPMGLDPSGDEPDWVIIRPLASGYRTEQSKLVLTTAYEDAYKSIPNRGSPITEKDFRVTLPLKNVVTIQAFDLQFYVNHFIHEAGKGPSSAEDEECSPEVEASATDTTPVGDLRMLEVPWSSPIIDTWCKSLKWIFYVFFTVSVIVLPFSVTAAVTIGAGALLSLYFLTEPVSEKLTDLIESAKDA